MGRRKMHLRVSLMAMIILLITMASTNSDSTPATTPQLPYNSQADTSQSNVSEPSVPPRDGTAQQQCHDTRRNVTALRGEVLPLSGQCARLLCAGPPARPRFFTQRCEPVLDKSCQVQPGETNAPFPDCCEVITCAGHRLQHSLCFSPLVNAPLQKGEAFLVPGEKCSYMECRGYAFDRRSQRPSWRFIKHGCSTVRTARRSCVLEEGIQDAPFPLCCRKEVCLGREREGQSSSRE